MSQRSTPDDDIAAALACASELGLGAVDSVVLKLGHHTSIKLGPLPIVARVRASEAVEPILEVMRRELDVARHLARAGAPAVRPTADPPPGPYVYGRRAITLWSYVEHRQAEGAVDALAAGRALREVVAALASYPGELRPFTDGADACAAKLAQPFGLPALSERSRLFLAKRLSRLREALRLDPSLYVPLHGDTHLGNVMMTSAGPIWADLEAACRGPIEWELTSLPSAARHPFGPLDQHLFAQLSELRSLTVAVWCWSDADRSPEVRAAGEYHLRRLRRLASQRRAALPLVG